MTLKAKAIVAGLVAVVAGLIVATRYLPSINDSSPGPEITAIGNAAKYVDGTHYRTLESPVADADVANNKISVREFFWYGCPHCRDFEPGVRRWLEDIPADVAFQQLPVAWNEFTRLHAAMFYAAEETKDPHKLHDKLFEKIIALRPERNLASHVEQVATVFADHELDPQAFESRLKAPDIQAKIDANVQMMKQAQVQSTPTVLVDGRWVVLNNEAVAKVGVFNVIDHLLSKARSAK